MGRFAKQLHIYKDGEQQDIYLYTSLEDIDTANYKYISLIVENTPVFARLVTPDNSRASRLRVIKGGTTYAVAKECYFAGSATYPTVGTSSFTVPEGVHTLNCFLVGGGGGAGGNDSSGDNFRATAGGSGGYQTTAISVTPGDTVTVTVGKGGKKGYWCFNGGFAVPVSDSSGSTTGATGGTTSVAVNGVIKAQSTGGVGGHAVGGAGGAGGTPNGVAGQGCGSEWNQYDRCVGGNNGTGWGTGGYSFHMRSPSYLPTDGQQGYASITW